MLFSTKKIRNLALMTIAAVWMVSVISLGMSSLNEPECDPGCPMELRHGNQAAEISYERIEKKMILLTGVVGWVSQYYGR